MTQSCSVSLTALQSCLMVAWLASEKTRNTHPRRSTSWVHSISKEDVSMELSKKLRFTNKTPREILLELFSLYCACCFNRHHYFDGYFFRFTKKLLTSWLKPPLRSLWPAQGCRAYHLRQDRLVCQPRLGFNFPLLPPSINLRFAYVSRLPQLPLCLPLIIVIVVGRDLWFD